mmetsp:Transcript_51945/g.153146  ORF Transcript_51945/g.153146 Transcript_51945/m.153146 type:complete len:255 (-) Transcript_51945:494-1258(-)
MPRRWDRFPRGTLIASASCAVSSSISSQTACRSHSSWLRSPSIAHEASRKGRVRWSIASSTLSAAGPRGLTRFAFFWPLLALPRAAWLSWSIRPSSTAPVWARFFCTCAVFRRASSAQIMRPCRRQLNMSAESAQASSGTVSPRRVSWRAAQRRMKPSSGMAACWASRKSSRTTQGSRPQTVRSATRSSRTSSKLLLWQALAALCASRAPRCAPQKGCAPLETYSATSRALSTSTGAAWNASCEISCTAAFGPR